MTAVAREERLVRLGTQVDDREPSEPEADAPISGAPDPFVVGAAMDEPVAHPSDELGVDGHCRHRPDDAAHQAAA